MSAPVTTPETDIRAELTGRFLADSPLAELAHVALGTAVTLLLIGFHSPWGLALWVVSLWVTSLVRYRVRRHYARKPEAPTELPWPVIATIVIVGLVWSAGAMPILLRDDRELIGFVMIVECGLAAAATFTFQSTVTGFRVFIASIYVPLVIGILSQGVSRWSVTGTLLVVVFGGTMMAIQRRGCAQLTRSLQLLHDLEQSRHIVESDRAELRESERRLFQFLESMPVGVIVVDNTGKLYFSNAAAQELAGPALNGSPDLAQMRRRAPGYIPGTQQPYPFERSPTVRALKGETSIDQVELITERGLRLVEIHGSPIYDRSNQVAYAVAVLSDLSGRQKSELRRAAMNAVLSLTAEATSEEQLLSEVLELLTVRFDFALAEMWMTDSQSQVLRRVGSAQRGNDSRVAAFDRASASLVFRRGEGLPGHVWRSGEPFWRRRTPGDDLAFIRNGGAVEAGVRTAVSVPVFVAGVASGALVLFTTDERDPDGPIMETLMAIGAQIGGAIGRRRADAAIRAAEERYRQLVEASTDLVWEQDLQGRWTFVNAASNRIYGFTPEQMIGRYSAERSDPKHAAADRAAFARLTKGEVIAEYETVHRNAKDAQVVISTSAAPLRDASGRITGYHGIIRDVADRAAAREALRAARDAAEQAAAAKSAFLANMSHEIRTPMNGVLGVAELLQSTDLDADQRHMVDLIATSGNSLLTVINEILDFSKIEAQQLEIESVEFDLLELVESTVKLTASAADSTTVEIVTDIGVDVPEHVVGDPTRLRQVLSNLLGNAIKFTKAGEVVVGVERVAGIGRLTRIAFFVRDTGIGMSAETVAKVFEPFRQADSSTTRRYGGTGLGLTISRRLIELMGAELAVASEPGKGSRFSFELTMPVAMKPPATVAASLRGTRALVVDDNATNLRVIKGMLGIEGVDVDVAAEATTGLRLMRECAADGRRYDVVVSDAQMPVVDGHEFVRRIRSEPSVSSTPVVMATSGNHVGDSATMRELGVSSVLLKPLSRREVSRAIQAALNGSPRSPQGSGPRIGATTKPLTVLIAEDNPINQEVARAMLSKRGHRVDVVGDGRAAVTAALSKDYDTILMDIQMPELDGLDATREIRERRPPPRPRIIALTANALPGERERCLAGGMDGYLAKPFAAADLFAVLEGDHRDARMQAPEHARASLEPIELDALREDLRAAGIEESLETLVKLFLRDGPGRVQTIVHAAKQKNADDLARAAHALKSAAGAIRASGLMRRVAILERTAKDGEVDAAVAEVGGVVDEHRAVREWLEKGKWKR